MGQDIRRRGLVLGLRRAELVGWMGLNVRDLDWDEVGAMLVWYDSPDTASVCPFTTGSFSISPSHVYMTKILSILYTSYLRPAFLIQSGFPCDHLPYPERLS